MCKPILSILSRLPLLVASGNIWVRLVVQASL
jgi:hypothetical protein